MHAWFLGSGPVRYESQAAEARKGKTIMHLKLFAMALLLVSTLAVGCTPPIYHHSYTTKYDANGKVAGYEEEESITQQDPSTSPMKVRVTNKDKLEK